MVELTKLERLINDRRMRDGKPCTSWVRVPYNRAARYYCELDAGHQSNCRYRAEVSLDELLMNEEND